MAKPSYPLMLLIALAIPATAQARTDTQEFCGLGPPPGSPQFIEYNRTQEAIRKKQGFLTVCEQDLARFDLGSQLQPWQKAQAALGFKPVDLRSTPFAKYRLVGALPEQRMVQDQGASALYRSFLTDEGRTIYLFEWDMSVGGAQIVRHPADEPERINGMPARLDVLQTKSGKAISMLSWTEGRRSYELWINSNVKIENNAPMLMKLASSLPKSEPARSREPATPPLEIGPDGMPKMRETPSTLSEKEMRELVDSVNRK